ncbi:long-chain-fatty-acid--CoA ligase FadD13-like [Biomphalaria glabrata]|uniref:Long-chain-fatty-acid--CoA ligase FadD13-like n=1 Tax=Biomphalaria glabrata TaxID=6526 RepID=A0A9W2ZEJ1_BIOGL|nr:long-chain-fatty-acid--CoA ligase FadD13-like [Biomphalaria glabrata]
MGGVISSMKNLETIPERLQYLSEKDPDKELYIFYNCGVRDAYTCRELFTLGGRFAYRLHQLGFQKGDVIANTLANSPERLVTDVGIVMAGCIALNGQVLLADGSDFFHSAKTSRSRAVIVADEGPAWQLVNKFISDDVRDGWLSPLAVADAPELKSAIVVSRRGKSFLQELKTGTQPTFLSPSEPDDILMVMTTSGSTGYCKLVPRTHRDTISKSVHQADEMSAGVEWAQSTDKKYIFYSDRMLGWSGGCSFYSFCQADTRVMLDQFSSSSSRDKASELWGAVEAEQCQTCVFVAQEMENVRESLQKSGGPRKKLNMVIIGGQPCRKRQIQSAFCLAENVYTLYASTEAYPISSIHLKDANYESNNCGRVVKGMFVKVCRDNGELCETNETGTIYIKGQYLFPGYFNRFENPNPQNLNVFTADGWFNTEDYGHFNDHGELFVFGRIKDIITYGSSVFYPGWLEKKLVEHSDIQEAVIVPVTDPVLYQNVCACIRLRQSSDLDLDKLKDYCDAIFLADVSVCLTPKPKYFIIMKEEFPYTSTGKPDKQLLKRRAEEMFGYSGKTTSTKQ